MRRESAEAGLDRGPRDSRGAAHAPAAAARARDQSADAPGKQQRLVAFWPLGMHERALIRVDSWMIDLDQAPWRRGAVSERRAERPCVHWRRSRARVLCQTAGQLRRRVRERLTRGAPQRSHAHPERRQPASTRDRHGS